jgi:hypothetical protein
MTWVLDTNFHQSRAELESGSGIEGIVCVGWFTVVGESMGCIQVFSVSRLAGLVMVAVRNIRQNHAISAMVCCDDVLFTGDTLGYVKN